MSILLYLNLKEDRNIFVKKKLFQKSLARDKSIPLIVTSSPLSVTFTPFLLINVSYMFSLSLSLSHSIYLSLKLTHTLSLSPLSFSLSLSHTHTQWKMKAWSHFLELTFSANFIKTSCYDLVLSTHTHTHTHTQLQQQTNKQTFVKLGYATFCADKVLCNEILLFRCRWKKWIL